MAWAPRVEDKGSRPFVSTDPPPPPPPPPTTQQQLTMTPQLAPNIVVLLRKSVIDVTMQLTPRLRTIAVSLSCLPLSSTNSRAFSASCVRDCNRSNATPRVSTLPCEPVPHCASIECRQAEMPPPNPIMRLERLSCEASKPSAFSATSWTSNVHPKKPPPLSP